MTGRSESNAVEDRLDPAGPFGGYLDVVEYLRREMALGRLREGDRLPSERRLSEMLGVARETLRQALRVLEGSGQIVVHRGSRGGATVQEVVPDQRLLLDAVVESTDKIMGLVEFRMVIEAAAASYAAERRSDDDLAALRAAQDALASAATHNECRHSDTEFHLALAKACGNEEIYRAVEEARVKMFDSIDVLGFDFLRDSSLNAHERILDAIRDGDGERAAAEMRAHLAVTRTEFGQVILAQQIRRD